MAKKATPTEQQKILTALQSGPIPTNHIGGRAGFYNAQALNRLLHRGKVRLTTIEGRAMWVLALEPSPSTETQEQNKQLGVLLSGAWFTRGFSSALWVVTDDPERIEGFTLCVEPSTGHTEQLDNSEMVYPTSQPY